MANDRVQDAIERILNAILTGEVKPGQALAGEKELAAWLSISRTTMREALRSLSDRGVLSIEQGRGTYVIAPKKWTDLSTIIWWIEHSSSAEQLGTNLAEMRSLIEVGAAGLAAARRTDVDLQAMATALSRFDAAVERFDVESAAQADLEFHSAVLAASGNPFLPAIMQPLAPALHSSRLRTTWVPESRERVRALHDEILQRIRERDVAGAETAMRNLIEQLQRDMAEQHAD